ncbi:MAG: AAA family ATPase [Deferribacteraceae bacterium]|jgi:general secretion pathway protein A|nr:AAA family ATPase [Deferribacteraceae bacterium]
MDKKFINFFGFAKPPFNRAPNLDFYFMSNQYQNALQTLNSLFQPNENYAMLIGHPGTGKSATLYKFIKNLPDYVILINTPFPNLKTKELLRFILHDLGIEPGDDESQNSLTSKFKDFLTAAEKSSKVIVLIIDEAQKTPDETLEEIFKISEECQGFKIIIAGRPELDKKLNIANLRFLKQKISLVAWLNNLTQEEVNDFLDQRSKKAGRENVLIGRSTAKLIWEYTKGNPRIINVLMERAIMVAYMDASDSIKNKHINSSINSLNSNTVYLQEDINSSAKNINPDSAIKNDRLSLSEIPDILKTGRVLRIAPAAALAICLTVVGVKLYNKSPDVSKPGETSFALPEPITPVQTVIPEPPTPQEQPDDEPVPPQTNSDPEETQTPVEEPVEEVVAQTVETVIPPQIIPEGYFGIGNIAVVATDVLNVRISPMVDAEKIATIYKNYRITVVEESALWVQIELPGGRIGWVYKQYLSKP